MRTTRQTRNDRNNKVENPVLTFDVNFFKLKRGSRKIATRESVVEAEGSHEQAPTRRLQPSCIFSLKEYDSLGCLSPSHGSKMLRRIWKIMKIMAEKSRGKEFAR